MAKKKNLEFDIFIGEMVSLVSNVFVKHVEQTEEAVRELNEPIIFTGFLLDIDDSFYYIGETPSSVSHAIKKEIIISISLATVETHNSVGNDIFDSMASPKKDEDYN